MILTFNCQGVHVMMDIKEYTETLNLKSGESKRIDCPNCNGQKTFTVTNNMGILLWNCYKASCSMKGSSRVRLSVDDIKIIHGCIKETEEEFKLPEYIVPIRSSKDFHRHSYNFFAWLGVIKHKDVMYDVKDNRVVFLIKKDNKIVDATGRANSGKLPKWKRYGNSNIPYSYGDGNIAVVVEDCISAYVVGRDKYTGVALLGTSLSEGHRTFISSFDKVVVALDPDALPKTLHIAKELKGWVKEVKVLRLIDDLKYRDERDLNNLKELKWN